MLNRLAHPLRNGTPPWVPLLAITLVLTIVMSFASDRFLTSSNAYVILLDTALLAVIGLSQLAVLSVGEFSLAIGGIGALSGITAGYLIVACQLPVIVGLFGALIVGAACGVLNGIVVAKSGISGFIITLATGTGFTGIAVGFTKNQPFNRLPEVLTVFGTGRWGAIPYCIFATIVLICASAAFFRWNRMGRRILAVGGNAEAVTLSGLSSTTAVVYAHVLSGVIAAAAGVIAMAQLHEANPSVGSTWVISSLTVAVIALMTGAGMSGQQGEIMTAPAISLNRAGEIALEQVPGGTLVKSEYRLDQGQGGYSVHVIDGGARVELKIDASTGQIMSMERSNVQEQTQLQTQPQPAEYPGIRAGQGTVIAGQGGIDATRAREIALARVGGGTVVEFDSDYKRGGRIVYEFEILGADRRYEIDIDGLTGAVVEYQEKFPRRGSIIWHHD